MLKIGERYLELEETRLIITKHELVEFFKLLLEQGLIDFCVRVKVGVPSGGSLFKMISEKSSGSLVIVASLAAEILWVFTLLAGVVRLFQILEELL